MKKMLFAIVVLLALPHDSKAQDLIKSTLLDHVMTVTQFKSGETSLALVDSIVQIGSIKGASILDLQAGFNSETKPDSNEAAGARLIAGGFFKVSSLLKTKIHYPPHWEFLNTIEHGVAYFYDFREKKDFVSYQVGFAFDLKPVQ